MLPCKRLTYNAIKMTNRTAEKLQTGIGGPMNLAVSDFARILGAGLGELPPGCVEAIRSADFRHHVLSGEEREKVLLRVIKALDSGNLSVSGKQKRPQWENGWAENLSEFTQTRDINRLIPKFVRRNEVVRLQGEYCQPVNPEFETAFVTVLRIFLFERYFRDVEQIFEFGCGTGLNLVALARMYPEKVLHGLDWAESSRRILEELSPEFGNRLRGYVFDMFSPDSALDMPEDSALFTIGTMEQLGTDFEAFLQFALNKRPKVCLHVETVYELYDQEHLFDYVAARYLERRNWLRGYLSRLRELESAGKLELIKCQRTFGSLFHDGYSYIVWRPKNV